MKVLGELVVRERLDPLMYGFNVKSLVALGAATFSFSKDFVNAFIGLMTYAENWVLDKIQGPLISFLQPLFDILGISGDRMNQTLDAIQGKNLERTAILLSERLTEMNQNQPSNLANLSGKGVEQVVNVWGTKDVLLQTGIGGKRINLAGVNTINIEIVGAKHEDYMRQINEKDPVSNQAWNTTVSQFTTDLIVNSNSTQKLNDFLTQQSKIVSSSGAHIAVLDQSRGVWVIKLPDWENQQ